MLFNPIKIVCLEEIREVVEFVNRTIESELSMQQLSDFTKWDFHFVEDISEDNFSVEDVGIPDLEDYYEHVVSLVVDHFGIELDFSFLATKVAQELTEKQVITIIKEINNITKTGAERVYLHDIRSKYKKSKVYLELSFLLDDEPDIVEVLRIADMSRPINVDGDIVESKDFLRLTGDGRHSNRGWNIEYNPKTNLLYKKNWSNWQGEGSYYDEITLKDFLEIIKNTQDVGHTRRHVKGLKQYIEAISN